MPQDGESPLARVARAIVEGDGFALGRPHLSDDGTSVALPVLRTRPRPRGYVLSVEVADEISAVDPGRIDRVRVLNETQRRVFLPPGTLLEGGETASRGTTMGVILEPGSTAEVEVLCVHPSRAIRPGAVLRLAVPAAPDRVRRALLSRDQGLVWSVVHALAQQGPSARDGSDDLVSVLTDANPVRHGSEPRSSATSSAADQCGLLVLDARGPSLLEVFDSPESWQATAARGSPSGSLNGHSPGAWMAGLTLAAERAPRAATEFLESLCKAEARPLTERTWASIDFSSECTLLGESVLHLVAFGGGDPWTHEASTPRKAAGHGTAASARVAEVPEASMDAATSLEGEGEVAVAQMAATDADEDEPSGASVARSRTRKVLTSGWDAVTFESLERFSGKEFAGDRSAALRFLVRQGLRRRGYMGPRTPPPIALHGLTSDGAPPRLEMGRAAAEARIHDFERIASTDVYADWLRVRAREQIERLASSTRDEALQAAARSALDRLPPLTPVPVPEELPTEEPTSVPPPIDVRPLLRRAFAASAAGQYSDALRLLDEVLDSEPDHRTALLGRAVALRRSGKASEALAALDVVLRLEPANAAALLNRGRVLQEMGDLRGALETFDRLARVAPNDWDVWVARGDVLARMGRVHDALAAYSEAHRRNPDDEGVAAKIRGLERTRPPPPPTPAAKAALPREIQEGQSYLVQEPRPDLSYRLLRSLVVRSVPALVVAGQPPAKVWAEHALQGVAVLQLSHEPGEDRISPTSLPALTSTLERFVLENHGRAAILLDGLSLLVDANGFRDTALFLERVNEAILPSHAVFLISVAPRELEEKEFAILERSMRPLA